MLRVVEVENTVDLAEKWNLGGKEVEWIVVEFAFKSDPVIS